MSSGVLDFQKVKRSVLLETLIAERGLLDTFRLSSHRLVGPCPLHGGDNPSAFVILRAENRWRCFTRCQASGDVIDFVSRLEQLPLREVAARLAERAWHSSSDSVAPVSPVTPFVPFTRHLSLVHSASFLAAKGIREPTARTFQAGQWRGRGFLADCIAVRLFDPIGRPLGYAGRRLVDEEARRYGKWKLPRAFPAARVLYNFHRVSRHMAHGCVVVECPWSVMRLYQLGIPAVALFGTLLSDTQRALLGQCPRMVLLMDGDSAGRQAASRLRTLLGRDADVAVFDLPDGCDPDDLPDTALQKVRNLLCR